MVGRVALIIVIFVVGTAFHIYGLGILGFAACFAAGFMIPPVVRELWNSK